MSFSHLSRFFVLFTFFVLIASCNNDDDNSGPQENIELDFKSGQERAIKKDTFARSLKEGSKVIY